MSKILLHLHSGTNSTTTAAAILPTDLRKLFQFIDNNNDRSVTVDRVIAVLNLDCISGIENGQIWMDSPTYIIIIECQMC